MKCCGKCGVEIDTKDGENECESCGDLDVKAKKRAKARAARKEREYLMRSMGLVKVKGALGGTYWE